MNFDKVILVDQFDNIMGFEDKLIAHQNNLLHRAFSVFIYYYSEKDNQYYFLLQKRASKKYHSPNLISNSCCSHQQPNFDDNQVIEAKVIQEIGYKIDNLLKIGTYLYSAKFHNNMFENELDHIYISKYNNSEFAINKNEVSEIFWMNEDQILALFKTNRQDFTIWFEEVFNKVLFFLKK